MSTGLTALFLLVRCTVPERDYTELGIGGNAGNGAGGSGDGMGGTSDGQGGDDPVGQGGQDGGTSVAPIPCDAVSSDAGSNDAGIHDAGSNDAGVNDAGVNDAGSNDPGFGAGCACVDGFIQAIDRDGDGDGTRECAVAPGLDCDDNDNAITHNSCGGCSELPNVVGEDCLDCGAYVCDGPEAVICGAKPDYSVVDPDCRCHAGLIVARDTDEDGQGTRLCEESPGTDCNDGDNSFVTNACGGCAELPGTVGADCNQCGAYTCSGTSLVCAPKTGAAGRQCLDSNTRQTCLGTGFWSTGTDCISPTAVCYLGSCESCRPGTFKCDAIGGGSYLLRECMSTSSLGVHWSSIDSCTPGQTCNANIGQCTGHLLLPRDQDFDVVPRQRGGLPWHDVLNTASDSDYG